MSDKVTLNDCTETCECTIDNAIYLNSCLYDDSNNLKDKEVNTEVIPQFRNAPIEPVPDGLISDDNKQESASGLDSDGLQEKAGDILAQVAKRFVMSAGRTFISVLETKAHEKLDQYRNKSTTKGTAPKGSGDGGGRKDDPYSSNYRGGEARLSYDPKPIEVRLNTGIKPNTYTSIFEYGTAAYSSVLHMTTVTFEIPFDSSRLSTYFQKILTTLINQALQRSVSFNIDPDGTVLTASNLKTTFNYIIDALNQYFFWNSVLTYSTNPNNRNDGMMGLRKVITADAMNNLLNLKRLLRGTPIPPAMIGFFMYLNQTFQFSLVPGSPIFKICPVAFTANTGLPDVTGIATAVNNLSTTGSNYKILNLLARACPKWLNNEIPDVAWNPIYDPNMNTIWANLPFNWANAASSPTTAYSYPFGNGPTVNVYYNSFTNDLDGGAFALTSIANGSTGAQDASVWYPSLLKPYKAQFSSTVLSNRMVWSNNGYFVDAYSDAVNFVLQRNETYAASNKFTGLIAANHVFGSQPCEIVSGNTVAESTIKLLDFLINLNTIGRLSDNREYSTVGETNLDDSKPKYNRRRNESKSN